jgi:poly(A) polymerase
MESVVDALMHGGHQPRLVSFSALDRYCGLRPAPIRWVDSKADLAALAKIFGDLRFPGPDLADAATGTDIEPGDEARPVRLVWYLRCEDDDRLPSSFPILDFAWDVSRKSYIDPGELYPTARSFREGKKPTDRVAPQPWWSDLSTASDRFRAASDAAILLSRYRGAAPEEEGEARALVAELIRPLERLEKGRDPTAEEQRTLLSMLLVSRRPELGLSLLKAIGYVDALWPELGALDDVDHSKEYHPEGNVWVHTLETFRYRKLSDLGLSLGLLLHDVGKPLSEASKGRRFDRHAELGAVAARSFLGRLGFDQTLIDEVFFFVRNHMMPAALPRLPLNRMQETLESPLFPLLLELYRCDESSSFKGPEGFYESCAAYRTYLKHVKNPYRSADGKKLMRRLFEK